MITLENVTRRYGEFIAVDNISFSISPGEIVGLLGHNGAGKTTIMKMLTGYLEPTEGKITINGSDITVKRDFVQRDIGYLPENCPVYLEMTVLEYLDYAAALHGIPAEKRTALVADAISQTALADKAHQTIATLSRGYRQRTGVAQALLHKPQILILDEPTNGLDPTQIQQMRELIKGLAKYATIIISTHILQEVQAVCDRVIIIRNGQLGMDTRLDSLQSEHKLLVTLDASINDPESSLASITGVKHIRKIENSTTGRSCFSIELTAESNREESAAAIARKIHDEDWALYGLRFESRDLESVFAQISEQ